MRSRTPGAVLCAAIAWLGPTRLVVGRKRRRWARNGCHRAGPKHGRPNGVRHESDREAPLVACHPTSPDTAGPLPPEPRLKAGLSTRSRMLGTFLCTAIPLLALTGQEAWSFSELTLPDVSPTATGRPEPRLPSAALDIVTQGITTKPCWGGVCPEPWPIPNPIPIPPDPAWISVLRTSPSPLSLDGTSFPSRPIEDPFPLDWGVWHQARWETWTDNGRHCPDGPLEETCVNTNDVLPKIVWDWPGNKIVPADKGIVIVCPMGQYQPCQVLHLDPLPDRNDRPALLLSIPVSPNCLAQPETCLDDGVTDPVYPQWRLDDSYYRRTHSSFGGNDLIPLWKFARVDPICVLDPKLCPPPVIANIQKTGKPTMPLWRNCSMDEPCPSFVDPVTDPVEPWILSASMVGPRVLGVALVDFRHVDDPDNPTPPETEGCIGPSCPETDNDFGGDYTSWRTQKGLPAISEWPTCLAHPETCLDDGVTDPVYPPTEAISMILSRDADVVYPRGQELQNGYRANFASVWQAALNSESEQPQPDHPPEKDPWCWIISCAY